MVAKNYNSDMFMLMRDAEYGSISPPKMAKYTLNAPLLLYFRASI